MKLLRSIVFGLVVSAAGAIYADNDELVSDAKSDAHAQNLDIEPAEFRYLDEEGRLVKKSFAKRDERHTGIDFYTSRFKLHDRDQREKAEFYLLLKPVLGKEHCAVTSLTDSTGKNLLLAEGKQDGAIAAEKAITGLIGDENRQPYKIRALAAPNADAQYVTARGQIIAFVSTQQKTVHTTRNTLAVGNVFRSDEINLEVRKFGISPNLKLFRQDLIDKYDTQMQVKFYPAKGSDVPITKPGMRNCYTWRFIEADGTVHPLRSAFAGGGYIGEEGWTFVRGGTDLYAEAEVSEGRFNFTFWTDFKREEIPFEVTFSLSESDEASSN